MPADWNIVQGDLLPILTDTLTLSDGSVPNFGGATLQFELRSLLSATTVSLAGTASFTNVTTGAVQFMPAAGDTATPGMYMGKWLVTFVNGAPMSWPTQGWLWVNIEESTASTSPALVSLPDVKDYLTSFGIGVDRSHDDKLLNFIHAATPIIENIVGPVVTRLFEEWHDGGSDTIQLYHVPSTALGTNSTFRLMAASEYRGPIEYPLSIVPSPTFGSIYSIFLNTDMGTVTRRTAGGRTLAFMPGRESIHIYYQAGQATVPPNIREAVLETIRQHYQMTQATGLGRQTLVDTDTFGGGPDEGFSSLIDRVARQALSPMRQYPSFA